MASANKVTFTLDDDTIARLDRTAARLGISKSGLVREAVREYATRIGRLSEAEGHRLLEVFDTVIDRIPKRSAKLVDRELAAIRRSRRSGGRGSASGRR